MGASRITTTHVPISAISCDGKKLTGWNPPKSLTPMTGFHTLRTVQFQMSVPMTLDREASPLVQNPVPAEMPPDCLDHCVSQCPTPSNCIRSIHTLNRTRHLFSLGKTTTLFMKHRQKMLLLGKCLHLIKNKKSTSSSFYTTFNYAADVN